MQSCMYVKNAPPSGKKDLSTRELWLSACPDQIPAPKEKPQLKFQRNGRWATRAMECSIHINLVESPTIMPTCSQAEVQPSWYISALNLKLYSDAENKSATEAYWELAAGAARVAGPGTQCGELCQVY